ncbi:MAG: long-chain-acyl-CoA synthetase [Mycobacteriaceae bacterium]|nr:long-chain-acyl-CoA synthetase [Mycobacteriaceae bacterium]
MHRHARTRVRLRDVVLRAPGVAWHLPRILRNASGFGIRPDSAWSIGAMFQEAAWRTPNDVFLRFEGEEWTYCEANLIVNRYACALDQKYGVERGDVVGVMLENRPQTLFLVLAVVKLGAVAGMLNHHQRGQVLSHSIGLLRSSMLVVGAECRDAVDRLDDLSASVVDAADVHHAAAFASDADPEVCANVTAGEHAFLVFTSGTTGLPKASAMSHLRCSRSWAGFGGVGVRLARRDALYCCLPLYHNNALTVALSSVIAANATFALGGRFSASTFWDDIARARATAFVHVGEMCRYLLNLEPTPAERAHRVRVVVGNGLSPELWDEFRDRFRIRRVVEFYGASECPLAFVNVFNVPRTAGVGALPYAVVEYDAETGAPLRGANGRLRRAGRGNVGLLMSRVTEMTPFDGYVHDAKASEAKLIRNGFELGDVWFDTGDLVLDQGCRHVAFVDRLGDTFRWKGENVSATQVEAAIAAVGAIDHAVVYGVAVPGADGKAGMAAVVLRKNAAFDGIALADGLYRRLPTYAMPLFVRIVDELTLTSTFKNRKVELRAEGYDPGAVGELYVLAGRESGYVAANLPVQNDP